MLVDYVLAAVHMHWPYAEEEVLWRVLSAVKPGGLALVTGIEPYEIDIHPDDGARRGATARERAADSTVLDIEALGDATALLARRRSYRELPQAWVERELRRGGVKVLASHTFPMVLTSESLTSQLEFAKSEADKVPDGELRKALVARAARLQSEARALRGHRRARNYALVVQRGGG